MFCFRHLIPVLGEDRFFNDIFMWLWTIFYGIMLWLWSCSFAFLFPLFYNRNGPICSSRNVAVATGFSSTYRSHAVWRSFSRCTFHRFQQSFFRWIFVSIFDLIKRYRKRHRRVFETGETKSVRSWLGRRGNGSIYMYIICIYIHIYIYIYIYACIDREGGR